MFFFLRSYCVPVVVLVHNNEQNVYSYHLGIYSVGYRCKQYIINKIDEFHSVLECEEKKMGGSIKGS